MNHSFTPPHLPGQKLQSDAMEEPLNTRSVQTLLDRYKADAARRKGERIDSGQGLQDLILSDAPREPIAHDGTEYAPNLGILSETVEGDMLLTEDQLMALLKEQSSGRRFKRRLESLTKRRWAHLIYYRFRDKQGASWKASIQAGLKRWESTTCLRFREGTGSPDYLSFIYGRGCYSHVGRRGGAQTVSIGRGCSTPGIVAHEVGHALGMWHEQSRPDRDQIWIQVTKGDPLQEFCFSGGSLRHLKGYIDILSDNIIRGHISNFAKRKETSVNNYGNPYDFGSIMHYSSVAFARSSKVTTIKAKGTGNQQTIGQRADLSFIDVRIINNAYCSSRGCGGTLTVTSKVWTKMESSASKARCHWRIKSATGAKVYLQFRHAKYDPPSWGTVCPGYVEVKHKGRFDQTGSRFCSGHPEKSWLSEGSEVLVIHDTRQGNGRFVLYARSASKKTATAAKPKATTAKPSPKPALKPSTRPAPKPTATAWGAWGSCSRTCGGCGIRVRTHR